METRRGILLTALLVSFLLGVFGIQYLLQNPPSWFRLLPHSSGSFEQAATKVIETCSKVGYPPSCYDTELPKLMDQGMSMEDVFKVTSIIQTKTNGYFFCHVLGHNISAKETAKDPSKWTDVIGRCPTGMCSNGCLHGAAQERFRSEVLTDAQLKTTIPELASICQAGHERNFTGLEQASCYHALGHLAMYITGADIKKSTGICDTIAKVGDQDYTQTCYEGAYMQIFQPLEPEDFTLVKDIAPTTSAQAETYCETFSGEHRSACHRESWPLYRESLKDGSGLPRFCSLVPDAESVRRCYNGIFYVLVAQLNFELDRIVPLCESLPEKRKAQCFANASSRLIETDYRLAPKAAELCRIADTQGVGDRCYNEILFYSTFNYHKDTPEFKNLCKVLPELWQTKCLTDDNTKGWDRNADL